MTILWIVGAIATALLVPAVPVAVAKRQESVARANSRAEAERRSATRRQDIDTKAARSAAKAAETTRRAEVARINANPIEAIMVPATIGIANTVLPKVRKRDRAAEAVKIVKDRAQEAEVEAKQADDACPNWLTDQGWERKISLAANAAIPLIVIHFIFDILVFTKIAGLQMAIVYALMATSALAFSSAALCGFGMSLNSKWGTSTSNQRYWWGFWTFSALVATVGTVWWLTSLAELRSQAHSNEVIASAEGKIEDLTSKKAVGDPTYSESSLESAQTNLANAQAEKQKAATTDRAIALVVAGLEMAAIEAALLHHSYIRPRRRAKQKVNDHRGLRVKAETALFESQQAVSEAGTRLGADLFAHYGDQASDFNIANLEQVIPEATARAVRLQAVTYGVLDPENERPGRRSKQRRGSVSESDVSSITSLDGRNTEAPQTNDVAPSDAPTTQTAQDDHRAIPTDPPRHDGVVLELERVRVEAENVPNKEFGNHLLSLDELNEI